MVGVEVGQLPVVDRLLMLGDEHVLHPRGVLSPGAHVCLVDEHPGIGVLNDEVPDPARIRVQPFRADDVIGYTEIPKKTYMMPTNLGTSLGHISPPTPACRQCQ